MRPALVSHLCVGLTRIMSSLRLVAARQAQSGYLKDTLVFEVHQGHEVSSGQPTYEVCRRVSINEIMEAPSWTIDQMMISLTRE